MKAIIVAQVAALVAVAQAETIKLNQILGGDKYSHLVDRSMNKRSSDSQK